MAGGEWCPYGTGGDGPEFPGDQRFDDGASICFDSEPLDDIVEILGAPVVTLDLAVDKPQAFVAVRLNDVKPDGSVARATYGILNLTHRNGHARVNRLQPGRRYQVKVTLNDTAYAFRPGHRIRVAISTTYWPMIWPSPEPVELTVHTGTSTLALPVRPMKGGPRLTPFEEPEEAAPMPATQLSSAPSSNTVTRDVLSGRVEVLSERGGGVYRIDEHGLEFGRNTVERIAITEGDPLSAETEMTVTSHMKRGDFEVDIHATTKLRATADTFLLSADLDVYEGKTRILAKSWSVPIKRQGV